MVLFAALVAVPFSLLGREASERKLRYGIKVFLEFVIVGLVLAWLMYFLP
jgi:hypothetical protein